jgi:hypothetical protein
MIEGNVTFVEWYCGYLVYLNDKIVWKGAKSDFYPISIVHSLGFQIRKISAFNDFESYSVISNNIPESLKEIEERIRKFDDKERQKKIESLIEDLNLLLKKDNKVVSII